MSARVERSYPIWGGCITAGLYLILSGRFAFVSRGALPNLFTAVVSVSAIAVGFLATAESILFSLENKRVTKFLKDADGFKSLVDYLMNAIHLSFALAALSSLALLLEPRAGLWWYRYAFATWLFILTAAALSYYRVVNIFARILRLPD